MNNINISELSKKFDKKLVVEIVIIVVLLAIAVWLYLNGAFNKSSDTGAYAPPGNCLILPQEYCNQGITTTYLGHEAVAFNLPDNTPIYTPFNAGYIDGTPEGMNPSIMKLGISDTSSYVVVVGRHMPYFESGVAVYEGEFLGVTTEDPTFSVFSEELDANLVIYFVEYDLDTLF